MLNTSSKQQWRNWALELQNHSITKWLRLEGTSGGYLLMQGYLEEVAKGCIQMTFEDLQIDFINSL